jgi:uncharacterized Zn finger protein (UPF0148 family)
MIKTTCPKCGTPLLVFNEQSRFCFDCELKIRTEETSTAEEDLLTINE